MRRGKFKGSGEVSGRGLRVALLADGGVYPARLGGIQQHTCLLAKYLPAGGVEVHLFTEVADERELALLKEALCVGEGSLLHIHPVWFRRSFFPPHISYVWDEVRLSRIYNRMLSLLSFQPDLIIAQGLVGVCLDNRKFKNVVVHPHGAEPLQEYSRPLRERVARFLLRRLMLGSFRRACLVVSIGGHLTSILGKYAGRERVSEVEGGLYGTDPALLRGGVGVSLDGSLRRLLFLTARVEPRKGLEVLGRALLQLYKVRRSGWQFTWVAERLPRELEPLLREGLVRHMQPVRERGALLRLLDEHEVLVVPSLAEGMPFVILEAMARGLAIIATDVGAIPVFVSGECGWLVPPGDAGALLRAMREAVEMPAECLYVKRMAALYRAHQLRIDRVAPQGVVNLVSGVNALCREGGS